MTSIAENVKQILVKTLEDRRLSRGEKRVLDSMFDELKPTDQQVGLFRSIAFDVARQTLDNPVATQVLDWLDDVIKVIAKQQEASVTSTTAESWFSPEDDCPHRIRTLLAAARQRVEICVFTITDDRISDAILDAHERGVAIRIISDDDKSLDRGSDIARLKSHGVAVRSDESTYHMHHKFAVFDRDLLLTGSYNWTRGAAEYNEENFVVTGEPRLVKSFSGMFEKLWDKFG
jgi:phosphatidylserine/phosphatidylglycerophosphate/cardiolipin synthase-like enzyme